MTTVQVEAVLEEFDEYLALQRGRSEHTRRAYLGDLRALFAFVGQRHPDPMPRDLTLPLLRSWLSTQATSGAARTTLARRTSTVKTFTAWASRQGLMDVDPATRLQVPKAHRTLPAVLRQDQAREARSCESSRGKARGAPSTSRTESFRPTDREEDPR